MRPYALALVPLLAACTPAHHAASAPGAPSPAAPRTVSGGCGGTGLIRGRPPAWNPAPAGFVLQPPTLPYVVGRAGTVMGYLYRVPLVAPPPRDGNKILWFVRHPRDGHPLRMTAHPYGAGRPLVTRQFPADSRPGEIYPSAVDVPRPGCWVFTLTWDGHEDTVALNFVPGTRTSSS
jgi:hypothetical protein